MDKKRSRRKRTKFLSHFKCVSIFLPCAMCKNNGEMKKFRSIRKNTSINQSIDQSINQSIEQWFNQSTNQSTNQSIDQSINQSIDRSKEFTELNHVYRKIKKEKLSCPTHSCYKVAGALLKCRIFEGFFGGWRLASSCSRWSRLKIFACPLTGNFRSSSTGFSRIKTYGYCSSPPGNRRWYSSWVMPAIRTEKMF